MNDVFPNFNRCCLFEPRVSMTLIAVLYIMGGSTLILVSELGPPPNRATFETYKRLYVDVPELKQTYGGYVKWLVHYPHLLPVCLIPVGLSYILIGIMTLIGIFFEQDTMAMLAVWQTLFTIIFVMLMFAALAYQCMYGKCALVKRDFLASAGIVIGLIFTLALVWYFLIFINTQVVQQ